MCAERNLTAFSMTRRALGARLAASAAALGLARPAVAAQAPVADPALRDAALRGLALAEYRGDPVSAAAAQRAVATLAQTDPEGALLLRLYRKLDVRPAAYYFDDMPEAQAADLALVHEAIAASRPLHFAYTDLHDNESDRAVLPLALVHPPQGVKLLAYCLEREDYRQFFVRAMAQVTPLAGDFRADRMALLEGLVEKEGA